MEIIKGPRLARVRPIYFLNGLGLESQARLVKRAGLGLKKNKWAWARTCMSPARTRPTPTPTESSAKCEILQRDFLYWPRALQNFALAKCELLQRDLCKISHL